MPTESEHIVINKSKFRKTIALIVVFVILLGIGLFEIPIPYNMTVGYTVKEPYSDTENYYESEPYTDIEYYEDREPYTTCGGYSFWTGDCNNWKTEYNTVQKSRPVTKYQEVQKSRIVTKYRDVEKERTEEAKATLYDFLAKKVSYYRHE